MLPFQSEDHFNFDFVHPFISYLLVLSRRRVLPCPRFEGMISVSSISFSLQRRRRIIPSRLIAGNATQLTFPFTS